MDLMTIVGIASAAVTVFYVLHAGNILHILLNPIALVVVFGGTLSATLIAYPFYVLKELPQSLKLLFFPQKNSDIDRQRLIEHMGKLSGKARKEGIASLESEIPRMPDKFMAKGIRMLIDGLEPEIIDDNLRREILYTQQSHFKVSNVFRTMATVAPIFGLLGTLVGVVDMLRNLSNPTNMGTAMASAVTATFYGILSANIFIPIATKLGDHSERDIKTMEMVAEGIISIQQGDVPLITSKKLNAFILDSATERR